MSLAIDRSKHAKAYTSGRGGHSIDTIVIHYWGDPADKPSFNGVVEFFQHGGNNTSAHYVVEAGRVAQMVDDDDTAYHAGVWHVNQTSIGIECNPRCTDADKATVAQLVKELRAKHGNLKLIGHMDVKDTDCPGHYYPPNKTLAPWLSGTTAPASAPAKAPAANIDALAHAVIDGKYGSGDARKKALGANYDAVQARVNQILGGKPSVDLNKMADDVIAGKYGNGDARKKALGSYYDAVQKIVNSKS